MSLEILVEGPSDEAALEILVPLVIPRRKFSIHAHQGKPDLIRKLPSRLKAYSRMSSRPFVLVLIDLDNEDCRKLKAKLEEIALGSGLRTKTASDPGQRFSIVNRIAITELEAWFFGDRAAMRRAFPRLKPGFERRPRYGNCEDIPGGAWEALEKELKLARYYSYRLSKIDVARRIAPHMNPSINASNSFQLFCSGLRDLLAQ